MLKLKEVKVGQVVKLTTNQDIYGYGRNKLKTYIVSVGKTGEEFLFTLRRSNNQESNSNILLDSKTYGKNWVLRELA